MVGSRAALCTVTMHVTLPPPPLALLIGHGGHDVEVVAQIAAQDGFEAAVLLVLSRDPPKLFFPVLQSPLFKALL
jgi:hypothetical protein